MIELAQLFALMGAVVSLGCYTSDGARYRGGISMLSGLAMASLAAWAVLLFFGKVSASPLGLIVSLLLLGVAVRFRGDVAKMIDRLKEVRVRTR